MQKAVTFAIQLKMLDGIIASVFVFPFALNVRVIVFMCDFVSL